MAVAQSHTFSDAYTPICNLCGVALCWDISDIEYIKDFHFWEGWECEDCHGSRMHPNDKANLLVKNLAR